MNISKGEKYCLIKVSEETIPLFLEKFSPLYRKDYQEGHIIADFSDNGNLHKEEVRLLLGINKQHREQGYSFLLVCNTLNSDEFPEELAVAPTLSEAEDLIEMEEIERDLGF
ncbi:MAG: hypothetical protein QGH06_09115 [Lutibacter sp.]|jgi:hypothetical protein|nr:hypothetical protein [Lutibacter sp.]